MKTTESSNRLIFSLEPHPLQQSLSEALGAEIGTFETRQFPDGESYLRIEQEVKDKRCVVVADLSHPNHKFLPLIFLLDTLRELGASNIGLVAPYLSYMRQDRRFIKGEALTSRLFAKILSSHVDWLVTVDPHLHRYNALSEIYSVPNKVVQGAPALASWLEGQKDLLLVGPDSESEQWVADIAAQSGHPFVIGQKIRYGDRHVKVELPDISAYKGATAVIIDDVISSGQTIIECAKTLRHQNIDVIHCAAIHGILSEHSDKTLLQSGLASLVTSNTIPHETNTFDITGLLIEPIISCLEDTMPKTHSCCGGAKAKEPSSKSCCQTNVEG